MPYRGTTSGRHPAGQLFVQMYSTGVDTGPYAGRCQGTDQPRAHHLCRPRCLPSGQLCSASGQPYADAAGCLQPPPTPVARLSSFMHPEGTCWPVAQTPIQCRGLRQHKPTVMRCQCWRAHEPTGPSTPLNPSQPSRSFSAVCVKQAWCSHCAHVAFAELQARISGVGLPHEPSRHTGCSAALPCSSELASRAVVLCRPAEQSPGAASTPAAGASPSGMLLRHRDLAMAWKVWHQHSTMHALRSARAAVRSHVGSILGLGCSHGIRSSA